MKRSSAAPSGVVTAPLIRHLLRQGWRRGVLGGSRGWTAVGGLALLGYLAGRAWHKEADIVFSEMLAPGETIRITHEPEPLL